MPFFITNQTSSGRESQTRSQSLSSPHERPWERGCANQSQISPSLSLSLSQQKTDESNS